MEDSGKKIKGDYRSSYNYDAQADAGMLADFLRAKSGECGYRGSNCKKRAESAIAHKIPLNTTQLAEKTQKTAQVLHTTNTNQLFAQHPRPTN